MLNRLPQQCPSLLMLLDDLGNPSAKKVASALDVSERTVRRWIAQDSAPNTALFALFWLTRWGQSSVDADAHNSAVTHASMVRCLRDEVALLTERLKRVGQIGEFGSANDPSPQAPQGAPAAGVRLSPAGVQAVVLLSTDLEKAQHRLERLQRRLARRLRQQSKEQERIKAQQRGRRAARAKRTRARHRAREQLAA